MTQAPAPHTPSNHPRTSHERLASLIDHLSQLQAKYESVHDSRCVFTYAYVLMTTRIDEQLDRADLADPEWTVTLAEHFAARYFKAVSDYDNAGLQSKAWLTTFDAIRQSNSSVLEDLVFAITAHIVHDLPLALVDTAFDESPSHLHDYDQMNDILGKAIDEIRNSVTKRYNPGLRWLDRIEGRYDQVASDYGIRMSRGLAWYNAQRLVDPTSRQSAEAAIERSPSILVESVSHPPVWSIAILLRLLRTFARLYRRWPRPRPLHFSAGPPTA